MADRRDLRNKNVDIFAKSDELSFDLLDDEIEEILEDLLVAKESAEVKQLIGKSEGAENERALKEYSRPALPTDNYLYALGYGTSIDIIEQTLVHHLKQADYSEEEKEGIFAFFKLAHIGIFETNNEDKDTFFSVISAEDRVGFMIRRYQKYAEEPALIIGDVISKGNISRDIAKVIDSLNELLSEEGHCHSLISEFLGMQLLVAQRAQNSITTDDFEETRAQVNLYQLTRGLTDSPSRWPYRTVYRIRHSIFKKKDQLTEWEKWIDENPIHKIVESLDQIVGQEQAKYDIAFFVRQHVNRLVKRADGKGESRGRNNAIIIGPSGSGKSEFCQVIRGVVPSGVPVIPVDTTSFTDPGYKGPDAMTAIAKIREKLGDEYYNSIIIFDEADKVLGGKNDDNSQTVSDELLGLLQHDSVLKFEGGKDTEFAQISSECISYAFAGTFGGVSESDKNICGFVTDNKNVRVDFRDKLQKNCGISPEFLGRISQVITLSRPTKEDIIEYMLSPKSTFQEVYELAEDLGFQTMSITPEAMELLASQTAESSRGMRDLQNTLREILKDHSKHHTDETLIIDEEIVLNHYNLSKKSK